MNRILNQLLERFGVGPHNVGFVSKQKYVLTAEGKTLSCMLTISAPWWIPLEVFKLGTFTLAVFSAADFKRFVNPAIKLKANLKQK